jgi:hypothetical protein
MFINIIKITVKEEFLTRRHVGNFSIARALNPVHPASFVILALSL